ncbi:hypothetical protein EHQ12_04535 [Leptospira gomenensis]|uniref:Uncharacterized protein n=1 Tax=Leptospira gomenensis TaxID=2484974 RepID=A0A5F1YFV7_9LEPT|nr:hypothetical protein [Leptospira gomenensis]TGK38643.1 hypothetical protein EHQ17_00965 [Leptospira gomenensis]TGK42880.1 hypothetical protein EHQ12_04535 [Leptospira gomenensis]TGK49575.1 hypothetical protein EHQ07_04640 [Leptospira gomenensis]TGK60755.1 hypothetical protein EHQ13_10430 [Leptospira gomenensis]
MESLSGTPPQPPPEEIKRILYHSIVRFLSSKQGPISKSELKDLLEKSINLIPELSAHWAEINRFGKNKMILYWRERVMLLDMGEVLDSVHGLWNQNFER